MTAASHREQPVGKQPGPARDMVQELADRFRLKDDWTTAQALTALRRSFPNSPLATRLATLAALMRQRKSPSAF